MAKIDVLDILKAKRCTPAEFNFDSLWIPPIQCYLTPYDIEALRKIATSLKLSSKIKQKYQMIDDIMRYRGFKRFSAGTNRVVYSCLEDDRFLVKIAVDKVGMQDNPMEYKNQFLLKPYVAKMFYHSPCGTVGFVERVLPIKNKAEFKEIASDVFDILVHKILGEYVMEDIGTSYFMNYGVRMGHAPVLLDYPYLYKLDGNKLYCTKQDPSTSQMCNGEIDYDAGFNHLVCSRCGKVYLATDLRDNSIDNKIIIKRGGTQMQVVIKKGDQVVGTPVQVDDVMVRPKRVSKGEGLEISISDPNRGTVDFKAADVKKNEPAEKPRYKFDFGVEVNGNPTTTSDNKVEDTEEYEVVKTSVTKTKNSVTETVVSKPKDVESDEEQHECNCNGDCGNDCKCKSAKTEETVENDSASQQSCGDVVPAELQHLYETTEIEAEEEDDSSPKPKEKDSAEFSDSVQDAVDKYEEEYGEMEPAPKIKRGKQRERDEHGRFVSTKNKKTKSSKSNFIPAK